MNMKNIISGLIAILLLSGIVVIASADTDTPWDMIDWNTVNWTTIFMGLTAIGALGAFIVEFYYRVYLPRKSQKDEDRKLIGSVLLPSIEDIIMKAKKFEELSIPTEVRTKIQDLPKYTEKIDNFNKKIERYNSLLNICDNFITYGLWYVCCFNTSGLTKDFRELSDSHLGDNLSICLRDAFLKGENIKISWLKDNCPGFCKIIKKCKHPSDFEELLSWIKRNVIEKGEFIFLELKKEQNFVISYADELKEKLERDSMH